MAAPTFVASYTPGSWTASTTPKTASVTVAVGDRLLVLGAAENWDTTLATPTGGTGFTWAATAPASVGVDSTHSPVYAWKTTATVAQTFTLSVAGPGGAKWSWIAYRFSGSDGFGADEGTTGTAGPSLAITTTGANSALVYLSADWNAVAYSSRTWRTINSITPTSGNGYEKVAAGTAGTDYGVFSAYWPDAGAAGAKTTGLSAPTGQAWAGIAVEIQGSSSGTAYDLAPADTAGLLDTTILEREIAPGSFDPVGITDTASVILQAARAPADSAGATDSATTLLDAARIAADAAGLTETIATVIDADRTPADSAGLIDSVTIAVERALADLGGITDEVTITLLVVRDVADAVGVIDATSVEVAGSGSQSIGDSVGLSDVVQAALDSDRVSDDTLVAADVITVALDASRAALETLGLSDSVTVQLSGAVVLDIEVNDSIGIVDGAAAVMPGEAQPTARTMVAVQLRYALGPVPSARTMTPVSSDLSMAPAEE